MDCKMGESVSFGKYENDALSWEKWSTFSPNKYLEEVGKCSTPGSVAQKKAFFEAHYKKIAAMKAAEAELLDQETLHHSRSDDHNCTEIKVVCLDEEQVQSVDGSGNVQEVNEDESMQVLESQSPITLNSNSADKLQEAVLVNDESMKHDFHVDDDSQQLLLPSQSPTTSNTNAEKLDEAVLVNDASMKLVKQHFHVDLETQDPQEIIPKQKVQNVTKKMSTNKVVKKSIGMKKKPASLMPKSPETPASSLSKPKPNPKPKPKPTSSSPLKKASAPAPPSSTSAKNKYHSLLESRRVAPVSLHLSMSMSSVNSDTASSVTSSRRRSLFLEQMGDKDIVKRAFKTFQNRVNQLPSSDSGPKQIPTKRPEQKTSTSMAYQKENESKSRSRKAAEKINPARGQLGPTWKSVSSGSLKEIGVDGRRLKAGPTSVALESNERAERRKEFFKNLKEKSNAREAERSQVSLKSKDAEMKKLNSKAKRVPREQGVLKSTSDKQERGTRR